jgi:hypothetical protein
MSTEEDDTYFAEVNDTIKYKDRILNIDETFVNNEGKIITENLVNFNFYFNSVFTDNFYHFLIVDTGVPSPGFGIYIQLFHNNSNKPLFVTFISPFD